MSKWILPPDGGHMDRSNGCLPADDDAGGK